MRLIPKRWENYLPVGCRVPGTRFLPFKVPLKPELCRNQPENLWFTPGFLVESTPMLKAVIDLTNTDRYYDSEDFTSKGIFYKKINVTGGGKLPSKYKRKEFFDAVDQLCEMLDQDSDALIGVHCTHGLNRTGYLICKYMVSRMKIDPQEAINKFEEARGHVIERGMYVEDLMGLHHQPPPQVQNWREECAPPRDWRRELPRPPRDWIQRSNSSSSSRDAYSYRAPDDGYKYRWSNSSSSSLSSSRDAYFHRRRDDHYKYRRSDYDGFSNRRRF